MPPDGKLEASGSLWMSCAPQKRSMGWPSSSKVRKASCFSAVSPVCGWNQWQKCVAPLPSAHSLIACATSLAIAGSSLLPRRIVSWRDLKTALGSFCFIAPTSKVLLPNSSSTLIPARQLGQGADAARVDLAEGPEPARELGHRLLPPRWMQPNRTPERRGRGPVQDDRGSEDTLATQSVDKLQGLDRQTLLGIYRTMYLSRRIDDKEIQLKRQNKIYFQISGAGHEAVLVAAGMVLRPGYDWFYPYYRDRALMLQLGMTADGDAPGRGGRRGRSQLRRPPDAVALGPRAPERRHQVLAHRHPVPAGGGLRRGRASRGARRRARRDEVVYCSAGDGTTTEGEFWESLNTACNRKLPVLFLVEDNGYAISVPVEVQTAGGSISKLVRSFPEPADPRGRRLRPAGQPGRAARGGGLVPRAARARPWSTPT